MEEWMLMPISQKKAASQKTAFPFIPFKTNFLQYRQVPDEETVTVIINLIVALQFVEHGAHRLAGGGGQISDVLMRQEGVQQGLEANFAALTMCSVLQELNDAGTAVFEGQSFQSLLCRTQLLCNLTRDFETQFRIGAEQFTCDAATHFEEGHTFVHGDGRVCTVLFAKDGTFTEQFAFQNKAFEYFFVVFAVGDDFDTAAFHKIDAITVGTLLVNRLVFVQFNDGSVLLDQLLFGVAETAEEVGKQNFIRRPVFLFHCKYVKPKLIKTNPIRISNRPNKKQFIDLDLNTQRFTKRLVCRERPMDERECEKKVSNPLGVGL